MLKIITLLAFSALLICPQTMASQTIDSTSTKMDYNYDFDENSFNISDEQFKEVQEVEKDNEKQSFTSKVINSSHFSSGTATRTWIPFRKNKY